MKLVGLLPLALLLPLTLAYQKPELIVNGEDASAGEFPFAASIRFRTFHFCGGTFIAEDYVLTAAHCFINEEQNGLDLNPKNYEVYYDTILQSATDAKKRKVLSITPHPKYEPEYYNHDIAIIHLEGTTGSVSLAGLPSAGQTISGNTGTIIGWGNLFESEQNNSPEILQKAQVPIITNGVCSNANEFVVPKEMVCAGNNGKDTCQGDSGGPLLIKEGNDWKLVGITSFGEGCNTPGRYGVYTRVSEYLSFVNDVMSSSTHIYSSLCLILTFTLFSMMF